MRNSLKIISLLAAICPALRAFAAPSINVTVGSTSVGAGTPATLLISVSNSASASASDIEGMNFTVQIGDGTHTAPSIASVDLITGTVWAGHADSSDVYSAAGSSPQFDALGILTDFGGDFIDANGLLATVTIDTTGAAGGNYSIIMVGTESAANDSGFLDGFGDPLSANFTAGQVTVVVPEPANLLAAALGGIFVMLGQRQIKILR